MLHTINLAGETGEIDETPVSRTFGLRDMYRDFAEASNQHYLEEQLSRLESSAGRIISKILKAFEAGETEVWLARRERDTLRKFIFIMKYRGSGFHRRFYHQDAERYSANDRDKMLKYMQEKGFKKPIDVWFNNIKGMLELEMDLKDKWIRELRDRIYPDDAMWFIANTQMRYLAFCTASNKDDEFLLTENLYNIYEGPSSYATNPETGENTLKAYTEYHTFSIISPKLVMVLRSVILPVPEEDSNESMKEWRSFWYNDTIMQHNDPLMAGSNLLDLPIAKARNSYTIFKEGKLVLKEGEDGSRRAYHKFCFRFFPISTDHVNKINSIMLEESHSISTITFKSRLGARNALEYYLGMPRNHPVLYSYRHFGDVPDNLGRLFIKKLEQAVEKLGSVTVAVDKVQNPRSDPEDALDILSEMLEKSLPKEPSETMKLYMKLGGSGKTMFKDVDQSAKMLNLRIKIDVWSKGIDESIREEIRNHLRDLFCQLPARRVWFYLKRIRYLELNERRPDDINFHLEDLMDGAEDVIVNANHIIRANDLCRLMYFATLNHVGMTKNPGFDVSAEITLDEAGARRLWQIKRLAFGQPGSICDCGITVIEENARLCKNMVRMMRIYETYRNPFWTEDENVEMTTRVMIRDDFSNLVGKRLSNQDLKSLERVLFGVVYPTLGCPP